MNRLATFACTGVLVLAGLLCTGGLADAQYRRSNHHDNHHHRHHDHHSEGRYYSPYSRGADFYPSAGWRNSWYGPGYSSPYYAPYGSPYYSSPGTGVFYSPSVGFGFQSRDFSLFIGR